MKVLLTHIDKMDFITYMYTHPCIHNISKVMCIAVLSMGLNVASMHIRKVL